jgi:hypothetical protein
MFTRRQWLLGLGFVAALSVLIVFSTRAAHHAHGLHPKVDEPIQGWMDLRYIAHSYHVPPYVLADALKLPPGPMIRWPIQRIAKSQSRSLDAVKVDLMDAIIHARPPYPTPLPRPPAPARPAP